VWSAIVSTGIFSEFAERLGSAPDLGTEGDTMLEVRALLRWVLELGDRSLLNRTYQLTWTLLFLTRAETVASTSRTVEDGGRERMGSGCESKPVSVDQIHSLHGTLTAHKASELPKLQSASYVRVR
jgi:hypothetical protein